MKRKIRLFIIISLFCYSAIQAQTGSINGNIKDKETGETLVGATVLIKGTTNGTITDFEGNYTINNIKAGTYDVTVSYISYETIEFPHVVVKPNKATQLDALLASVSTGIDEVQVVKKVNRESEAMLLMDQKKATVIKESIGAKQLSNMGVSDAATATTKISGVTKTEGSGDVYIRGLGDRYLSTTMNGLPIPSDDVAKKNIDLKLFSTDVISNVGVSKTYNVSSYADQASGNVDIASKTVGNGISIGVKGGINTNVMAEGRFSDFKASQNMEDITFGNYTQPYELEEAAYEQSWNTSTKNLPVDFGISAIGGQDFHLSNGDKLSLFATAAYSGESEYRSGTYRKYESNAPNPDKDFNDVEEYITKYETSGLLNLTYNFSANSRISYNGLFINKTEDELFEEGRNGTGYFFESFQDQDKDLGVFIRDQNIVTTKVIINQLLGNHKIGKRNSIEWGAAYNSVVADEPNRIRNKVSNYNNEIFYATTGGADQRKSSQGITDKDYAFFLTDKLSVIDNADTKLNLNIGANFRYKTRDFESQYTSVRVANPDDLTGTDIDDMDELFLNADNQNSSELNLRTPSPSVYSANLTVLAGFADVSWLLNDFSGSLGVRYEQDELYIDYALSGRSSGIKETPYKNLLPALNLKYQVSPKSALRFAFSKTVTLPEFKEFAPVRYVSPEGEVILGDTSVKMSNVYNFDLKWELFPKAGELLSIATFYKIINEPINITLTKGSSQYLIYQNTAEQASVYGIEIEGKINLLKAITEKHKLNLSLNATKMWFNQDIKEYYRYNKKTEIGLQGASDFITNISLSYVSLTENPLIATITGNYSSDKIFALGGSEDVQQRDLIFDNEQYEKGFITLDFVLKKQLSKRLSAKVSAKNLLNPSIERTQKIERPDEEAFENIVRSYTKGRTFSIGLDINLN